MCFRFMKNQHGCRYKNGLTLSPLLKGIIDAVTQHFEVKPNFNTAHVDCW